MVAAKKPEEAETKPRKLATSVHLENKVYPAGSEVPADVAAKITNESAWASDES